MRCWNLPADHSVEGVKATEAVLEPTCWVLFCRNAGCLSSVRIYLLGTVLQGCTLFEHCRNLPAGQCVAGVQAVLALL